MGTRSVFAVQQGDGWRGRYVHFDGYPTWMGRSIWLLVKRDGIEKVVKTVTEDHYGWSTVNAIEDDPKLGSGYDDGRFVAVPGYGVAYTTQDGQSSPDEWITHDGDDWGTEWAYVVNESGMAVLSRYSDSGEKAVGWFGMTAAENGTWKVVEYIRWDDDEPDWGVIEQKGNGRATGEPPQRSLG